MKIQHHLFTLSFLFIGACFSKTNSKDLVPPSASKESTTTSVSEKSQETTTPHAEAECTKHTDCTEETYCFQSQCVTASEDMSCSLGEDTEAVLECIFTVDADGDTSEEILRITRDLEKRQIDIDIMDVETLQTKHFDVTTGDPIGDSPLVQISVIPKEVAGKPLLLLDVPGVEACDSSSSKYYLSYSSVLGIQTAISTFYADGEGGSYSSTLDLYPNGTAEYTKIIESYEGYDEEESHQEGPMTTVYRKCIKEGLYVDCSESEIPIKIDPNASLSKGYARLKGVPTKICNECEGCESDNVCATHHDFPKCGMQPCCDGSIEFEGECSLCPEGTIPDAAQKQCVPQ